MRPELRNRISTFEDNFTERKLEGAKPAELRRTLVAFANSVPDGRTAVLFLGVRNDGTIKGVSNPDQLQKKIREIAEHDCYPKILYSVEAGTISGRTVLAIEVLPSSEKPHFAGPAYIRVGSESVIASKEKYEELIASRHSLAGALLKLKRHVITLEAPSIGGLAILVNRGDSRYRERYSCRILDCTPHYVRLDNIGSGARISEPLENITLAYDEERHRPMIIVQPR